MTPTKKQLIEYLRHKKDITFTVEEVNIIINKLSSMEEPALTKRNTGNKKSKSS